MSEILSTAYRIKVEPLTEGFDKLFQEQAEAAAKYENLIHQYIYTTLFHIKDFTEKSTEERNALTREAVAEAKARADALFKEILPDPVRGCIYSSSVSRIWYSLKKYRILELKERLPFARANSIPIRSDTGLIFEEADGLIEITLKICSHKRGYPKVMVPLKPGRSRRKATYVDVLRRIINGAKQRAQLRKERARVKAQGSRQQERITKEMLTDHEHWPPSSSGRLTLKGREYYLSIGYSRPRYRDEKLSTSNMVVIHTGIYTPLTLAASSGGIYKMDHWRELLPNIRSQFYKRFRLAQSQTSTLPRRKRKEVLKALSRKWEGKVQGTISQMADEVIRIVKRERAGTVRLEHPQGLTRPTFFSLFFKGEKFKFPLNRLLNEINWKLSKLGVEVEEGNFPYISQICSKCGRWNEEFTFSYRRKHNWPPFFCPHCKVKIDAEENAARNILRGNLKEIIKKIELMR